MAKLQGVPAQTRALADQQGGLVTTSQALGTGMSPATLYRLIAEGFWTQVVRGLQLTRPGALDWPARVWASALLGGEDCIIGGVSALAWHKLIDPHHGAVTIYVPQRARVRGRGVANVIRGSELRSVEVVRALRTSSVTDAIVDASVDLTARDLEAIITKASQRRKLSHKRLGTLLTNRRSVHHRSIISTAAADASAGAHSVLELDYLRLVERPHGLPTGVRQARAAGRAEFRDVRYGVGLIVELDGKGYHVGEAFRDRQRDNRNALDGEMTLRYGAAELASDPCGIAREVARALAALGWAGAPTRCAACVP